MKALGFAVSGLSIAIGAPILAQKGAIASEACPELAKKKLMTSKPTQASMARTRYMREPIA